MIAHEGVGIESYSVFILIFQQEVIVDLLGFIAFEEPGMIMTLPSDVEGGAIIEDILSGEICHAYIQSKGRANEGYLQRAHKIGELERALVKSNAQK
jgi:hypothetical protein